MSAGIGPPGSAGMVGQNRLRVNPNPRALSAAKLSALFLGSCIRVTLACCKVGLDRPLIPTAFVAICFVRRGSPDLPFGRPEVSR